MLSTIQAIHITARNNVPQAIPRSMAFRVCFHTATPPPLTLACTFCSTIPGPVIGIDLGSLRVSNGVVACVSRERVGVQVSYRAVSVLVAMLIFTYFFCRSRRLPFLPSFESTPQCVSQPPGGILPDPRDVGLLRLIYNPLAPPVSTRTHPRPALPCTPYYDVLEFPDFVPAGAVT